MYNPKYFARQIFEGCLIILTACRFAWLPAGLGPRSTTFCNVAITLNVIFIFDYVEHIDIRLKKKSNGKKRAG